MRNNLLVACVLTACGGGEGGVSPENLPSEIGEVQCAKLADCCTPAEFMEQTGADSEAECRALITGFGTILTNAMNDSIDKGRIIYHPDRMADCITALSGLSCAEFASTKNDAFPGTACDNPIEPQVATGGECAQDFDCASSFCDGGSIDFNGNITYGMCNDRVALGQPCQAPDSCASDAFCDFNSPNGQPSCAAKLADGSACTNSDQCASDACTGTDNGNQQGTCGANTTCDGQ